MNDAFEEMFSGRTQDEYIQRVVHLILKESYKYYVRGVDTLLSDGEYDYYLKILGNNRELIPDKYKEIFTDDTFKSGSLYHLGINGYSTLIMFVAEQEIQKGSFHE